MRHLDLFSGIGGFALAAEMVWENVEHVFCDNEPFSQAILKKHWPTAAIYGDIRTLTADAQTREQFQLAMERKSHKKITPALEGDIDLLTGGFPCQPFSQAGRRRGTQDDRYLWPEMLRVVQEFHPRWVVGENVGGLVTWSDGMVLEQVCADLEASGYEVQAFIIPACAVGAPHRRDRIWIVAHRQYGNESTRSAKRGRNAARPSNKSAGRIGALSPDAERRRLREQPKPEQRRKGPALAFPDWKEEWPQVAARLCRVDDGIPRRLDRAARLKSLGNAIVPQVAAEIMRAIRAVDEAV